MASKASRRSQPTNPRAAAAQDRSGYGLLQPTQAKLLLGASLGVLALTVFSVASGTGRPARGKQDGSSAKQEDAAEKVTVKRPLPDHLTEEQVPKWVPYRQVSGRVELEPWDSVDAGITRDPQVRQDIMAPRKARSPDDTDDFADEEARPDEPPPSASEAAASEPAEEPPPAEETPVDGLEAEAPAPSTGAEDPSEATG